MRFHFLQSLLHPMDEPEIRWLQNRSGTATLGLSTIHLRTNQLTVKSNVVLAEGLVASELLTGTPNSR